MKYLLVADHPAYSFSAYAAHGLKTASRMNAAGWETVMYGVNGQGAEQRLDGVRVLGDVTPHTWIDSMALHAKREQVDAILFYKDPYILPLDALQRAAHPVLMFCPVDTDYPSAAVTAATNFATAVLTPTRHTAEQFALRGQNAAVTPHGIDMDFWTLGDKAEARQRLGWDTDKFIALFVGVNNAQPSRKNIERIVEAWWAFYPQHRDAYLHLHTNDAIDENGGVHIRGMARHAFNIPSTALDLSDQYRWGTGGYRAEDLRDMYRAADVLLAIGNEGFCLPAVEAQACGLRVISLAWSGLRETVGAGSWAIPAQEPHSGVTRWTHTGGLHFVPHVHMVVEALAQAYAARHDDVRERVRASVAHYDWNRVWEQYWCPTLKQIEALLMEAEIG